MAGRPWTTKELAAVRMLRLGRERASAARIGRMIGRSGSAVRQMAVRSGIRVQARLGTRLDGRLRKLNPLGWTDAEIGRLENATPATVTRARKRLGLPCQKGSQRARAAARAAADAAARKKGLQGFHELRMHAWSERGVRLGWPPGLRKTEVNILEFLRARWPQPATVREIAAGLGFAWRGASRALHCQVGRRKTRLGCLVELGLIRRSRRVVPSEDSPRGRVCAYSLAAPPPARTAARPAEVAA